MTGSAEGEETVAELRIDARTEGPLGLLTLSGEGRLETIDTLRTEVRGLRAKGAKSLIVGVQSLGFVDSASMGVLLELQEDCVRDGGALVLHGVSVRLRRMLDGMGLSTRFQAVADEAAARALVSK